MLMPEGISSRKTKQNKNLQQQQQNYQNPKYLHNGSMPKGHRGHWKALLADQIQTHKKYNKVMLDYNTEYTINIHVYKYTQMNI